MAKKDTIIKEKGAPTGGDENIPTGGNNAEPVKEEMVQVKQSDLNAILGKLESYEKNIDLLMKASDKERLARAQGKNGKLLIPSVKIAKWDDTDELVIGWKAMTNKAEVVNGRYIEDLTTMIFFETAEAITVPTLEFYRKTIRKEVADVVGREQKIDERGNKIELLKIRFENGKELIINSSFVNL
jgi:hypothetical protein